jgi:hypothetical protein
VAAYATSLQEEYKERNQFSDVTTMWHCIESTLILFKNPFCPSEAPSSKTLKCRNLSIDLIEVGKKISERLIV